ncbi:hypothetical protein O9G_001365 [Rozella allomycis CSF55]|uniref:Uncharacterized protein n=1 Tax=Rozella allomycis (strain CSF55) TaxID=988480 RepID=A0A075AQG8_ROZAC|nr:hypothetical protein O9G_001365 [Rozella allomycis CSF55]|eukprot:EPZ32463.1 hypothetical protein O9G_001365 [Rozella allomycis CSF55]
MYPISEIFFINTDKLTSAGGTGGVGESAEGVKVYSSQVIQVLKYILERENIYETWIPIYDNMMRKNTPIVVQKFKRPGTNFGIPKPRFVHLPPINEKSRENDANKKDIEIFGETKIMIAFGESLQRRIPKVWEEMSSTISHMLISSQKGQVICFPAITEEIGKQILTYMSKTARKETYIIKNTETVVGILLASDYLGMHPKTFIVSANSYSNRGISNMCQLPPPFLAEIAKETNIPALFYLETVLKQKITPNLWKKKFDVIYTIVEPFNLSFKENSSFMEKSLWSFYYLWERNETIQNGTPFSIVKRIAEECTYYEFDHWINNMQAASNSADYLKNQLSLSPNFKNLVHGIALIANVTMKVDILKYLLRVNIVELYFLGPEYDESYMEHLLNSTVNLETLVIKYGSSRVPTIVASVLHRSVNLRYLELQNIEFTVNSGLLLVSKLGELRNLKRLVLKNCSFPQTIENMLHKFIESRDELQ